MAFPISRKLWNTSVLRSGYWIRSFSWAWKYISTPAPKIPMHWINSKKKKALTYTKMSTDLHVSLRFLFVCLLYYIRKHQVNCATYLESHSRSAATCKCLASPSSVFSCTPRLCLSAAHTHTHTQIFKRMWTLWATCRKMTQQNYWNGYNVKYTMFHS